MYKRKIVHGSKKEDIPLPTQPAKMDEQYGSKIDYLARYIMNEVAEINPLKQGLKHQTF